MIGLLDFTLISNELRGLVDKFDGLEGVSFNYDACECLARKAMEDRDAEEDVTVEECAAFKEFEEMIGTSFRALRDLIRCRHHGHHSEGSVRVTVDL